MSLTLFLFVVTQTVMATIFALALVVGAGVWLGLMIARAVLSARRFILRQTE